MTTAEYLNEVQSLEIEFVLSNNSSTTLAMPSGGWCSRLGEIHDSSFAQQMS